MTGKDFLIKFIPPNSVGAEIGVWQGTTSKLILEKTAPQKLFLIDPWVWDQGKLDKVYFIASTKQAKCQADMDKIYDSVIKKFDKIPEVEIIREKSVEAAQKFENDFFDWVYIDGAHDYDNIKADLAAWEKKIKIGGLLLADDYYWGKQFGFPVQRAIKEFLKTENFMPIEMGTTRGFHHNQIILRRTT